MPDARVIRHPLRIRVGCAILRSRSEVPLVLPGVSAEAAASSVVCDPSYCGAAYGSPLSSAARCAALRPAVAVAEAVVSGVDGRSR
jgi:hypothetical protein